MEVKKVKHKNSRVTIMYTQGNPNNPDQDDEYLLKCADRPLPSFIDALTALRSIVVEICEFPANEDSGNYDVIGASFSWAEGVMGATITALKTLKESNAPLVINTPHKPAEPYTKGGDESNCLSSQAREALENLIEEALKYVNGDRAQGELFKKRAA